MGHWNSMASFLHIQMGSSDFRDAQSSINSLLSTKNQPVPELKSEEFPLPEEKTLYFLS